MKLAQLETFIAVAEELHFRRAAERLYTQPSAVSTTIQQLEAEYGLPLFIRNSRNVQLTPAGQTLLTKARTILQGVNDLETTARQLAQPEHLTLNVGLHDEGAAELNQVIAARWRAAYPNGTVSFVELQYSEIEDCLREGTVDCVLLTHIPNFFSSPASFEVSPLYDDPRVLVVPSLSPFAKHQRMDLATTRRLPFLDVPETDAALARFFCLHDLRDTSNDVRVDARTLGAMLHHVASGAGVITVTDGVRRFYNRPDVAYVPVPELPPGRISIATRASDQRPEVVAFADAARAAAAEQLDLIPNAMPV